MKAFSRHNFSLLYHFLKIQRFAGADEDAAKNSLDAHKLHLRFTTASKIQYHAVYS